MADIEIIHQHSRGFSETGQVSERSESFIKILTSFRHGALRHLKGAPLSVFLCVALHEADAMPGCSLTTMCAETGFSRPSVIDAVRFLLNGAQRFIEEAGLESDGTKRYRVTAFAWFGQKPKTPDLPLDTGSKNSLPPRPSKKFLPPHDDDDVYSKHEHNKETSSIHERAENFREIEKIFATVFQGVNVKRLAERVDTPELAKIWVDWCNNPNTQSQYRNPQGAAYIALMAQPNARPQQWNNRQTSGTRHNPKRSTITGKLANLYADQNEDTEP